MILAKTDIELHMTYLQIVYLMIVSCYARRVGNVMQLKAQCNDFSSVLCIIVMIFSFLHSLNSEHHQSPFVVSSSFSAIYTPFPSAS